MVAAIQILMAKPSNQIINVPLIYKQTNANTQKSKDFKIFLINSSATGEQQFKQGISRTPQLMGLNNNNNNNNNVI